MRLDSAAVPITTAQIAEAAGITPKQVRVWGKRGLLPAPQIAYRGRRGRGAVWSDGALEQSLWVRAQLEAGHTVDDVLQLLGRGAFVLDRVRELVTSGKNYAEIRGIIRGHST